MEENKKSFSELKIEVLPETLEWYDNWKGFTNDGKLMMFPNRLYQLQGGDVISIDDTLFEFDGKTNLLYEVEETKTGYLPLDNGEMYPIFSEHERVSKGYTFEEINEMFYK